MTFKTLPKDLKRYSIGCAFKRIIPFVLLTAGIATVLRLWGDILLKTDIIEFRICVYVIFFLIPFALFGIPFKLIDRTYSGTIERIDIETVSDSRSTLRVSRETIYQKNVYYLEVLTDGGKRINVKAYEREIRLSQNTELYRVGDRVFHLYGSRHIVVIPAARDTTVHCAVCGGENEKENKKCRNCGHTLISK